MLRELAAADLDFVACMLADPAVMRFWPRPQTRTEAEIWIQRQQERYARHGHGYWLAVDQVTGQPVGQAGLLMSLVDGVEEPGLGYIFHRPFWGKGLATEAAFATLDWAFNSCGYSRIICLVRPQNVPSLRVAQRLGLTPERYTVYAGYDHLLLSATPLRLLCARVS
jgi:RimJ/RimL family protein N-acetyltransferase